MKRIMVFILCALHQLVSADTLLVVDKTEASLTLLEPETGRVLATLPTGEGPHEIAVSADGETAVVANYGARTAGNSLTVVNIRSASVERTLDLGRYGRPHGIAFLDKGRVVVTTEAAGRVLVVDVATGTIEQAIATGQKVSHMLALDRERERAYVANIGSGSVTALDLRDGKRLKSVATGKGAEGIALSPDGHSLWVTNRDEDTVSRVRTDTMEVVDQLPSSSFPIRAEITPDGRWVLVTNARSAGLTVIDSESVTVAHKLDLVLQSQQERGSAFFKLLGRGSAPIGIQISPDGKRAYIAHAGAGVIQVLDIEKWQVIGELRAGSEPDGMGWSGVDVQPAFD